MEVWLHQTLRFVLHGYSMRICLHAPLCTSTNYSTSPLRLASSVTPSVLWWSRNINLMSIGYACQPHLRTRLTQGGRALPLETLGFRRMGFSPILSLLTPAFSLLNTPQVLSILLRRVKYAPLPIVLLQFRSFGIMLSPDTFSAQNHSTSELLRTL